MTSSSEYVSIGHPDKTADAIASRLLDEYIKRDPETRFAMEVQLKDHVCNLAGEVTSRWEPSEEEVREIVKGAIRDIGYTSEYAAKWTDGATLNADKVVVNSFIGRQSRDIAQGVDKDGWGDQGCMMGMATNEKAYGYLPRDVYFTREIGNRLYRAAKEGIAPIGLDIKTLVSIGEGFNEVEQVVVAAPMKKEDELPARHFIADVVYEVLSSRQYICKDLVINGTGAYVVHSSVGDAGVVGRKLAVDFYGLNCPIGGGSPWGKDATKADVTLNLAARYFSLKKVLDGDGEFDEVYTKIACCIGSEECSIVQVDKRGREIMLGLSDFKPSEIVHKFGLDGSVREDMFFHLCEEGLFSYVDEMARSGV